MEKTIEEIANQVRKDYMKKWRVQNKGKVALHQKNYWNKKAVQKLMKMEGRGNDIQENGNN